ncbi:uncharacterized protein LOC143286387 isoform X2 [Babylonia areolata]|uniref:uncharacterized protein LOC143286387 isoform X2 n=1 Tax=Babylonia areolata TaxID=304850 RepID=UPI003FD5F815
MLPGNTVTLCQGMMMSVLLFVGTDSRRCQKREEVGERVNNHYECPHPVFSQCCERHKRFTCCEPNWPRNLREQLQLWGTLGVVVVVVATVCTCLLKDTDLIRSATAKEALGTLTHTFLSFRRNRMADEGREVRMEKKGREARVAEKGREVRTMEEGNLPACDQVPLTTNMAAPLSTTSFIQHV